MGLFDTFKRNKTPVTPVIAEQPAQPTIAPTHISKKKKNTYTITFNVLCQLELFSMCRNTPLPVITLNGKQQKYRHRLVIVQRISKPMRIGYGTKT